MVVCGLCNKKLGATVEEYDANGCEECSGEFCEKCCTEYATGYFCKTHAPTCTVCTASLTNDSVTCFSCDDEVCEKCSVDVDGEAYCTACAPKCKDCKLSLTSYELCEICEESVCKQCQVKTKYTPDLGDSPVTVVLCKAHGAEFNERITENKIIIAYVVKLFKELRLEPISMNKNLSFDEDELIAQFETNNEWTVDVYVPKVGRLQIDIESDDFNATINTTAYNHETALADIRRGMQQVANGDQIARSKEFKAKRKDFLDNLALCDSVSMKSEAKKMIDQINKLLSKAHNGI